MNDLEDRLRRLSPPSEEPPPPIEQVTRRAGQLRRRRRLAEAAAATCAVAVVGLVGVNLPTQVSPDVPDVVFEQPPPPVRNGWTRTSIGTLTVDHPQGWSVLRVVGEDSRQPRVVLANRELTASDVDLALLARNDVRFSRRFPPDAVVFVVGGDYLQPPPAPNGAVDNRTVLPRPQGLAGDVVAWTGRVPGSILHLAAYVGPDAPASAERVVRDVAETVDLREPDAAADPMPPPESGPFGTGGLDTDNPIFTEPWEVQAEIDLDDDEVIRIRAKGDCVAVTLENTVEVANRSVQSQRCDLTPAAAPLERLDGGLLMGGTIAGGIDDIDDAEVHVLVARARSDVDDVLVRQIGGERARAAVEHGWVIAMSDGRIARLIARDAAGRRLGVLTDP